MSRFLPQLFVGPSGPRDRFWGVDPTLSVRRLQRGVNGPLTGSAQEVTNA
jgi:hypothetical protein